MRKLTITAALAAILALPGIVSAQASASASLDARATVLAPISVTDLQDLEFGDIIPGFARTILPGAAEAGRFQVSGGGASQVALVFTLPPQLDHATVPAATLPVSFGAASAGFGSTSSAVASTFDPSGSQSANLTAGELFVFIGGTVTPAAVQEPGTYTGTITLDVAYTGS
jgi:hypothetical protein